MPRISKDPKIRMDEILDTAEMLFYEKGYHETAVSDIVKKIGVAQGTFYYYLESKEAALEAIIQRHVAKTAAKLEETFHSGMTPPQKVEMVIKTVFHSLEHRTRWMFDYLYSDNHLHIVDRMVRQGSKMYAPLLMQIIEEGNQTGYFKVIYERDVMVFISAILQCLFHSLYQKLSEDQFDTRLKIAGDLIGSLLGLSGATLNLTIK